MNPLQDTKLSMLDLVAVREGGTVGEALTIARETARHVETLGFTRYWVAEHHNMPGIASSATAVLVGHMAGATSPGAGAPRNGFVQANAGGCSKASLTPEQKAQRQASKAQKMRAPKSPEQKAQAGARRAASCGTVQLI